MNKKRLVRCIYATIIGLLVISVAVPALGGSNGLITTNVVTPHSSVLDTNGTSSLPNPSGVSQDGSSHGSTTSTNGSGMEMSKSDAEVHPVNATPLKPQTKIYQSERGLIYEWWYSGQLVYTGCIPVATLAEGYGSIAAAQRALQIYPEYKKTCSSISIDNNSVLFASRKSLQEVNATPLSDISIYPYYSWQTVRTEDLGAFRSAVSEIFSAPGLDVKMSLEFDTGADTAYSVNGGGLSYSLTTTGYTQSTSYFEVSGGDARTIYFKYEYEYIHQVEWYNILPGIRVKVADWEQWVATQFLDQTGMQDTPIPAARTKGHYDNLLDLGVGPVLGHKEVHLTQIVTKTFRFELGGEISAGEWDDFSGNIPFGVSTTLGHYTSVDVVYDFQNLLSKNYEWYEYYWGANDNSNDGYVFTFEDPNAIGGACPYVSSWNGESYVHDNNILPASETSNGQDVIDNYVVQQPIYTTSLGDPYRIQLEEFEHEHSWIDSVSMLVVDHPYGTSLAVSPEGQLLTFAEPAGPISAVDSGGHNLTQSLGSVGDGYFYGHSGDSVVVSFQKPTDMSNLKLVMRADMKTGESIEIQIPSADGWANYSVIHPRELWAYEIVDLSAVRGTWTGQVAVRLLWTSDHKLDFVGLDTSPNAFLEISYARMTSAIDNQNNDVMMNLKRTDQRYAQLIPGAFIDMTFQQVPQTSLARDIVIQAVGHYVTINQGSGNAASTSASSRHLNSIAPSMEFCCNIAQQREFN